MKKMNILLLLLTIFIFSAYAYAEKNEIKRDDPLYSVYKERMILVNEIKKFEEKIGFQPTNNFLDYSDITGYPGCFIAPKWKLIYSIEDKDFDFREDLNEEKCLALNSQNTETFFYEREAIAEIGGTPVSYSLLKTPIQRFIFVILHEDFHEQLDFSPGIEEAAGTVFALEAAKVFAKEKFGENSNEYEVTKNYVEFWYAFAKEINSTYSELEIIYRHQNSIPTDEFELRRTRIIERLKNRRRDLLEIYNIQIQKNLPPLNGAYIGFLMTYMRHFVFMHDIFSGLDNDLKNFFSLFKTVDFIKPSRGEVEEKIGNYPFEYFAKEYEKITIEEIKKWLPAKKR